MRSVQQTEPTIVFIFISSVFIILFLDDGIVLHKINVGGGMDQVGCEGE